MIDVRGAALVRKLCNEATLVDVLVKAHPPLSSNLHQRKGTRVDLCQTRVHFRIRDVYLPDPHDVVFKIHADDVLEGKIVDMSDGGTADATYAVIEVDGINQPLIVPLDRILGVV